MGALADKDVGENYSELIRDFDRGKHIPNLRWMMRRTNFINSNCYIQFRLNNTGNVIPTDKIFEKLNGSPPKRILIESHHRHENSTFAAKFLFDWAHREPYINHFKFVFLITLKNLGKYTVETYIEQFAVDLGFRKSRFKTLHRLIEKFGEHTLLILDGLEGASSGTRRSLERMLYQDRYRNVSFIITCQRELFKKQVNTREIFYVDKIHDEISFDRKLTIQALDRDHRDIFIDIMVSGASRDVFRERVHEIIASMEDVFFENPLYFVLLNYVVLEGGLQMTIDSVTKLFKEMSNQIVKLSLRGIIHDNFDFFNEVEKLNEIYRNTFYRFGKIAVLKVVESRLEFELSDLTDDMYKLGFLCIRERYHQYFNSRFYYEGFYPSMLDFSVAFFVFEEWKKNKKRFPQKTISEVNEIFMRHGEKSFVVAFICGLMDKNCGEFFKQFKNHSALYSTNTRGVEAVFGECLFSKNFVETVTMFIPPEFYLSGPVVIKEREIIKIGLNKGRIIKLNISVEQLWHLPRDVKEALLRISVKQHFPSGLSERAADKITCKKLSFVFNLNLMLTFDSMHKYLVFFNTISATSKSLYFYGDILNQAIADCVYNGDFKHSKIDELTFTLSGESSGRKIVEYLITGNKIKQLTLITELNCQLFDVRKILTAAILSPHLDSLKFYNFTNLDVVIDLKEITAHGTKLWQKLWLHNVIIECRTPFPKPQCITSYAVSRCRFAGNVLNILSAVTPNTLLCNFNTMHLMIRSLKSPSWCGWNSINELILVFSDSDSAVFLEFLPQLSPITYIEMLKIEIRKELSKKELNYLISCLKMFKIFHFGIEWDTKYYDNAFSIVVGVIEAVNEGDQSKMASIDVFVNDSEVDVGNICTLLPLLLLCLQVDYPKRINVFSALASSLHLVLKQCTIDQNKYITEHLIGNFGVRLTYYEYKYDVYHVLSIKLR